MTGTELLLLPVIIRASWDHLQPVLRIPDKAKGVVIPTRTFAQRPTKPSGVKLTPRQEARLEREQALWLKWCVGIVGAHVQREIEKWGSQL